MDGPKDSLSHALIKRRIDLPTQPLLSVGITVILTRDQAFFYHLGVDITHLTREFDLCYVGQALTEIECLHIVCEYEVARVGFERLPQTNLKEDYAEAVK